jgi:hypothetical protein
MSDFFTVDTFTPRVGEVFHVIVSETHELKVLLSEVARLGNATSHGRPREPFSLVFHAAPDAFIPQQIYRVENAAMEPFDCFLVPIGPDANGMRFEAIYT